LPGLCRVSRRVWIALDSAGQPAALFGVTPVPRDLRTGQFWLLLFRSFDDDGRDLVAMTWLVMDEVFREFERVENVIDSRKSWILQLLASIGFTVERAQATDSGEHYQRVWQENRSTARPVFH
jgi:hypothetical protein